MDTLSAKEQVGHDQSAGTIPSANFCTAGTSQIDREAFPLEVDHQEQICDTFGRISLENAETSYVGSGHWIAILDGVSNKSFMKNQQKR
jgi:hypothetical protein